MKIILYKAGNFDHLEKSLGESLELEGNLLNESCDVKSPSILFPHTNPTKFNYAFIPDFGLYYFAEFSQVRTGLWRMDCTRDSVMSYAEQIRNGKGIAERQENEFNLYINDPTIGSYANPLIVQKKFNDALKDQFLYLVSSGKE